MAETSWPLVRTVRAGERGNDILVKTTMNYRSTAHIVAAANAVIALASNRMKGAIVVDKARARVAAGGVWAERDPVAAGRVQVLELGGCDIVQAQSVMQDLSRLAALDPAWDWSRCAVIAREWRTLDPVHAWCLREGIPVQRARDDELPVWRLRETQRLLDQVGGGRLVDAASLGEPLSMGQDDPWVDLLRQAVDDFSLETRGAEVPVEHRRQWLADRGGLATAGG